MRPLVLNFHERPLTQVKINHEGDLLLTCSKDGTACLVKVETGDRLGTYNISETIGSKASAVFSVDITKDSKYVVTGSADGALAIFDAMTGEELVLTNTVGGCKFVEFNQKPLAQDRVAVCCDKFAQRSPAKIAVYAFSSKRKRLDEELVIDDTLPMKATQVKWGPLDKTLLSIHEEGTVFIWDAVDGHQVRMFEAHLQPITSLQFSRDMDLMVTSSKDHNVKLWRTDTYECIKTYAADRPLNDACISPLYTAESNPKYHILCGGGQEARDVTTTAAMKGKFETCIFHMVFEEELCTIKGHFGPINAMYVMPTGEGFVTGGEDGIVRINFFDQDYFNNKRLD